MKYEYTQGDEDLFMIFIVLPAIVIILILIDAYL